MSDKKSFQIYFDNLAGVERLDRGQRGDLLLALIRFARNAAADPAVTGEQFLSEMPEPLDPLTGMVFLFMAGNIRRDTQKWQEKAAREKFRRIEKKMSSAAASKQKEKEREEPEQSPLIKLPGYPAEPVNVLEKGQSWEDYRQEQLRELGRVNPRLLREDDGRWY